MKTFFTLIFSLISLCLFAHQVTVTGVVRDVQGQNPIAGVTIAFENTSYLTTSDSKGAFSITIPSGDYTLVAQKEGFASFRTKLIADDAPIMMDIQLPILLINMTEVMVSADRPVSAASSRLLNAIDFELRPRNSAQDMLRLAPGLFIAQHAGGGKAEQIFVRGFDCDHGTDIAGSVDGMPVNMVSHGHGQGYMDLHFIIPETVRNMEVHKGPYFAEFGDFSTAAAVRFNTYDALPNNLVQFELGSTPTHRGLSSGRTLFMYQLPVQQTRITSYFAADLLARTVTLTLGSDC